MQTSLENESLSDLKKSFNGKKYAFHQFEKNSFHTQDKIDKRVSKISLLFFLKSGKNLTQTLLKKFSTDFL